MDPSRALPLRRGRGRTASGSMLAAKDRVKARAKEAAKKLKKYYVMVVLAMSCVVAHIL